MSNLKRFRPSFESICSHSHCVETPSTIPCAHCPLIFCLRHLVEHQTAIDNEQKRLLSSIEINRISLKNLQFEDNRYELYQQIDQWKETLKENVEHVKDEINRFYQQSDREFNEIKEEILKNENDDTKSLQEIFSNLEQTIQILKSSRLKLKISNSSDSIPRLIKPDFHSSFLHIEASTNPINLEQILPKSELIFTLDFDPADITLYTTSSEYLLLYNSSRSVFQLYNILGQHLCDIPYDQINHGDINQIIWSSYANAFLLATSKQLMKFNCSTKRFGRYNEIGFGLFKDVCSAGESIVLVHNLGTSLGDVIEHYSQNQLIQRCWKSDLYLDENYPKDTIEIFRIRMSSHLVAIDALFTDYILVCDLLQAMKCLFRIDTKQYDVQSISPIYDTKQWLLFISDTENESVENRMFVIDGVDGQMRELKCEKHHANNICFFGRNHLISTRYDNLNEETLLFDCRKFYLT